MSQKLGNINIILTNLSYEGNEKTKDKNELINDNKYYALINKKRKRNSSHKNLKFNINRCPSCASALLSKYYKHIHDKNIGNEIKSQNNDDFNNNKFSEIRNTSYIDSKNMKKNDDFFADKYLKINKNEQLFTKNEAISNQETFNKNPKDLNIKKNENISKFNEKRKELLNENKINFNDSLKNDIDYTKYDSSFKNNNSINFFDENITKKEMNNSAFVNENESAKNKFKNEMTIPKKIISQKQIYPEIKYRKLEQKSKNESSGTKNVEIILKVQKLVAPENKK